MNGTRIRIVAVVAALGLLIAACGTASATGDEAAPTTTMPMEQHEQEHEHDHDHDMGSMNMGDPDATAAYAIENADVVAGSFATIGETATSATGTAWLARHDGGTTVTIELEGLEAGAGYVSHVHAGQCEAGGGPHYQFTEGGDHHPPNEIHLAFTASDDGTGAMTAENMAVADERAVSVIVHAATEGAPKLVCADLGPAG